MYSGWISDRTSIEDDCGSSSVLNNYPDPVGRDVTSSVIRSLLLRDKRHFFKTEKDIDWTMDVICFGLTMPLTEVEMIKNCVFIYRDWTTVMSSKPNSGIPSQIIENKEFYFARMLKHLSNLFIPRESAATILQATLCDKVLNHVRNIVQEGKLEKNTSEVILRFYLGISGHLLSVPPFQGGLAEQLCEKLINCLIHVWLHISCYHFPSPTLWSTLREMMLTWRHHDVLISQWNNLMFALTRKVLSMLFGPTYPLPLLPAMGRDDLSSIMLPSNLTDELAVQCWFRFLHTIGSPVSLCNPQEICETPYFMQYALESGRDPDQHPCLKNLPNSFFDAMRGISVLVGMFLGGTLKSVRGHSISSQSFARGDWKSASTGMMDSLPNLTERTDKLSTAPVYLGVRRTSEQPRILKVARDDSNLKSKATPNFLSTDTNSILHLFGSWLFDVSLSGVKIENVLQSVGMISCGLKPKSLFLSKEEKEQSGNFPSAGKNEFEPGRAEAFSTLCRIFCHYTTTGQAILPVYLSRFYLSLAVGLCYGETRAGQVLGNILLSTKDILRIDLQGVQVLVPHLLQAIEIILPTPDRELILGYGVPLVTLRRSCIQILLSMLCLPLHFLTLHIQGLCREKVPNSTEREGHQVTFLSLKERMTKLLMHAIKVETDPLNTQMLLGGAMLLMEDTMCVERKNHEFSKLPSGSSMPCILLEDSEVSVKGSPKLIHIAKTNIPKQNLPPDINKAKSTTKVSKSDIGLLGKRDDVLSTKGQFVYMTGLLCQNLMFASKWRGDLHVTLAALECLSGMAQLDAKFIDEAAASKTLIWTCDYIEFQAKQPPPSHSKDLHSIIVAAFSCISSWISNHPWLLDDQHCLAAVLEVIELGISGSKSKSHAPGASQALKGEKELKPVSFRVRESAEALLALMMEHLGFFPTPCGPASISSLVTEDQLITSSKDPQNTKFHYYAIDSTIIIGLHEDTVKGLKDDLPSVTTILRGPAGKRVCLMQLRHFAREKQHLAGLYKLQPERPLGLQYTPAPPAISQQCYPTDVNRIAKTNADLSLPELDTVLDEKHQEEYDYTVYTMKLQNEQEELAKTTRKANSFGLGGTTQDISQNQPSPVSKHEATRLLLSHLGMLRLDNLQVHYSTQPHPGLQHLSCTDNTMSNALTSLDAFPSRTFDTIYVFFVKKGQHDALEIQKSKVPSLGNTLFMEFLHSLGWQVNLATHKGWNGDITTSWKTTHDLPDHTMFYYADSMTEVAIHVPALNLEKSHRPESLYLDETDRGITEEIPVFEINERNYVTRKISDSDGKSLRKHTQFEQTGSVEVKHRAHSCQSETKVIVAWLQDFNDHINLPALDLIEMNDPQDYSYHSSNPTSSRVPDKEVLVIYIHPLKTGLFRIMTKSVFGSSLSVPLVDGMVVSRRVLGTMVRNTAINACRRRRLEIDSYSPPQVCRKIKIQDIIRKHKAESNIPEFYASLFKP